VIRVTGYGVIAEKPRVGQLGRIFPCTLYEKLSWIKKMDDTFLMRTTSSITMQSLGKIVLRAPAVGAKMWCLFFFGHALSREHRAFEGRIVRTSVALPFIARFRRGFQRFFSQVIALSEALHSSYIRC